METFTKENLNKKGRNYVAVVRLFQCYDVQPYAVTINGAILVRTKDMSDADAMGYGALFVLRAMGYDAQIIFND